ncbi:DUF2188 domain-containing protein [Oxalobacteraceae bacterium R-40]|uniref:DUF2188 domain-containing protein n=1 Tax=Keguizhuia sedimenti TaxID=3064264 RepID=A0ABU1BST9_9BURK|nr:DUF2188 domain-containing protein [Oxalobacteraceae bacterium R-40]
MSTKTISKPNALHVRKASTGQWQVVVETNKNKTATYSSKAEAVTAARKQSAESAITIHSKEGQIVKPFSGKTSLSKAKIRAAVRAVSVRSVKR